MRIALSSRGSRGDIHPVLAIAAELRRRGHEVRLCVPPLFAARARDLDPTPLAYDEDSEDVMREFHSGLQAARVGLHWFSRSIDEQFQRLQELTRGADALVTSVNEIAAPSVAEHRGIPHYRVAYAPILPGPQPPPLVPWQHLPRAVNQLLWRSINGVLRALFGRQINAQRRRLGLPPTGELGAHLAGKSHNLLAINPTLGPPVIAWRHPYSYTGYCFDEDHQGALAPALEAFLDAGPPPLYLGFGSVSLRDPAGFTARCLAAARQAGLRVILARGWTGLGRPDSEAPDAPGPAPASASGDAPLAPDLGPDVFLAEETPHAALFPRLAGIAHHGGSGTLHSGALAGVPQLAMPQIADQYYWGERIHRLGLGPRPMAPGRLTVHALADALRRVAQDPGFARRAQDLAPELARENGAATAARIIEDRSPPRSQVPSAC